MRWGLASVSLRLGAWLRAARRRKVSRQAGFALLVATLTTAILGAVVGEFSYNTRVELESATNARDQLRAEYLARSGINLSRLIIKVQQSVLDKNRQFTGDLQLADFAPYLVKAFGGDKEEREGLSALLGVDASSIKGLGVGKGASFDVDMGSEDGKINVNCAGGLNAAGNTGNAFTGQPTQLPQQQQQQGAAQPITNPAQALYTLLTAVEFPTRYNRLFENPDSEGQYATRDEIARAIIDWSDVDEQRYEPLGPSSAGEDYRYDGQRDSYRAHNNYFDTTDEMHLVRGVGDEYWGVFGNFFTVYGSCKVNLNAIKAEDWPIRAAILRAAAKNPQDPILLDETKVAALSQQIGSAAQLLGGLQSVDQFASYASGNPLGGAGGAGGTTGGTTGGTGGSSGTPLAGVDLDTGRLRQLATVGPRQVYRVDATGTIERPGQKKIQVHVRAVFDTQHFNQNIVSNDPNDRAGTWVYWRME
jgi:general secretion pathway protein K